MKKKEVETSHNAISIENSTNVSTANSMVDIVVRIKQDDTFANLKVSSFDLILSLEFLLKLAQFVTVPDDAKSLNSGSVTTAPIISSNSAKRNFVQFSCFHVFNITEFSRIFFFNKCNLAADMVSATSETDPNKKITILINIEQPDIILVEAMDDIDCLALILNVSHGYFENTALYIMNY